MTNRDIIRAFKLTASLLELHAANPFKIRSYQNAALNLERLEQPLLGMTPDEVAGLEGIGKGMAERIARLEETESFPELDELLTQTPPGVVKMLSLKGLGPKKVRTLWQSLKVESEQALLEACENDQVAALKGFGKKTQESIRESILFSMRNAGKLHLSAAEALAEQVRQLLLDTGAVQRVEIAGQTRRKLEIVDQLELLAAIEQPSVLWKALENHVMLAKDESASGPFVWRGHLTEADVPVAILTCRPEEFAGEWLLLSSADAHLQWAAASGHALVSVARNGAFASEEAIYQEAALPAFPPELREGMLEAQVLEQGEVPRLLEMADLKGILHNHSTYSDGKHTLEEMARYCQELGYQYLGISDHSKTAAYAGGLQEFRVQQQHEEIDRLNKTLAPFKILKGIESDILGDGSLDYADDVLASFDFVVASVHSNLGMDQAHATDRLLRAIENPYTTMLGHPTGRLLLRREGYPLDFRRIIDACAEHNVIIEINANPWRLDLDWRWVPYALEKGVLISINPDAHEKAGYADMYYGVCMGRKGGLTADKTFNAWPLDKVETWLQKRRSKA